MDNGIAAGLTQSRVPSETIWDAVEYERDSYRVRRFVEGHIMMSFAGPVAEARFRSKPREETAEWDHDYGIAFGLAVRMCSSEAEVSAYLNWLYERTVSFMALPTNVAAVDGVVVALLEQRTLSGRRAKQAAKAGVARWLSERAPDTSGVFGRLPTAP